MDILFNSHEEKENSTGKIRENVWESGDIPETDISRDIRISI
jgi:hypothetical protein